MTRVSRLLLASALLVGCAKGPVPELQLAPGKADIEDSVQMQGQLAFGDEFRGEFTEELQTVAWTFHAAPGAVVTIDNSNLGTSRHLDTLLYVFGPRADSGFGARSIARDDDSGWGPHARIRDLELTEGGEYLIAMTTYMGAEFGRYRVALECESGDCAPVPEGPCTFGESFWQMQQSENIFVVRRHEITSADGLSLVEQQQLIATVAFHGYAVATAEEALENVDAGEVNVLELWDASNGRAFEVYEFGLGDNSFGNFFDRGRATIVGDIVDGDVYCDVPLGPQGRECSTSADCADGLRCEGTVDGVGRCFDASFSHIDETADCERFESADRRNITDTCPVGSGLICSGIFEGGPGLCFPMWQRSRQSDAQSFERGRSVDPGATLELPFTFRGMTSVSMDARVSGYLRGEGAVRISLINPTGTEGVVFEGSAGGWTYFNQPAAGIPGDEDANGEWILRVRNDGTAPVSLGDLSVEIQSRWD